MEILTERQKQSLRFIVKSIREGKIDEEFRVHIGYTHPGIATRDGRHISTPELSALSLDALCESGLIFSRSQQKTSKTDAFGTQTHYELDRYCYVTPAGFRVVDSNFSPVMDVLFHRPPIEITDSLAKFRHDYPDPTRLAFVMMSFADTKPHGKILEGVRAALDPHTFIALRADDKHYHDDLYYNILTYIYGCRFGIAIFERIESDAFNPNVSLEIGYMLGLNKCVCLLKERSLQLLPSDLVGKLYRSFDAHDPKKTIPPELFTWMDEKGFIVRK